MNEKGASLLVVLITISIFMILGVTILSVALGGAVRSQIQLERYENIYEGKEQLDYIIARFKEEVVKLPLETEDLPYEYQNKLNSILDGFDIYPTFEAIDLTEAYIADKSPLFTRVYEFSIVSGEGNSEKSVKKRVILSPAPSFLDYSLGAFGEGEDEGILSIHGSPNVDGDVIANHLLIKNEAEFTDESGPSTAITTFPAINGNVNVQRDLTLINQPSGLTIEFSAKTLNSDQILPSFFYQSVRPDVFSRAEDFVEVNFEQTYLEKLNHLIENGTTIFTAEDLTNNNSLSIIQAKVQEHLVSSIPTNLIEDHLLLDEAIVNSVPSNKFFYPHSLEINSATKPISINKEMVINGDLTINATLDRRIVINQSLTVLGDLTINISDTPVEMSGTIVVHGDVKINGNEEAFGINENDRIKFDSTIYAWGESIISNTNIEGIDQDKQLVLFSKGPLTITRINEFKAFAQEQENENIYDLGNETVPLKAFFYTEDSATLYGVGSMFHINGGLFAKKELEINAIRGNTSPIQGKIDPTSFDIGAGINPLQDSKKTRFQIVHDPSVLVSQVARLPVAERLRVIVDDTSIR